MSDSKDKDKADNLGFSWGKKKGVGGRNAKIKVQFYESFTYDGDEYCIGDSIYLFKEGEPEPYIGKLIKIWDSTSNKSRKVKVLWFFKPSEISNYLEGVNVLENELFLACGEGVGLTNINPLEAIAGKCNVICISKDERNRRPSDQELEKADYVFYRTFDVGNCTISDKLDEKIAATEVSLLLNKNDFQFPEVSPNIKDSGNLVAGIDKPLINVRETLGEDEAVKPDVNASSLVVKDDEGTKDLVDKQKCHSLEKQCDAEFGNTGLVAVLGTEVVPVSGQNSRCRSPDCNQTDLDEVNEFAANVGAPQHKASLKSKHSGVANTLDEKTKIYGRKLVESGVDSVKDSALSTAADEGKLELAKDINGPIGTLRKEKANMKANSSRDALEEKPSKKIKVDKPATPSSVKGRNDNIPSSNKGRNGTTPSSDKGRNGTTTPFSDKGRNDNQKSGAGSIKSNQSSRYNAGLTAGTNDKGKLAEEFLDTSNGPAKKLKSEYLASGSAVATEINGRGKPGKDFIGKSKNNTEKLDSRGIMVEKSNEKCRESLNQPKSEEIEAYGQVKEVTQRPNTGKRNWFTAGKHEDLMKSAREQGTLVLLQNLDPTYTSSEVEDIVWHGFGESCTAKMVPHTATCSPHSGEAFVIFKTRVAAERVVNKLDQECLMLPNERPLVGSIWVASFDEQSSFPGHLVIDKLKHQLQREAKAVSTSHCAQPNTLEYEMAIEWRLLQERADLWWRKLFKQQGGELKKLTASFKSKRT